MTTQEKTYKYDAFISYKHAELDIFVVSPALKESKWVNRELEFFISE